MGNKRSKYTEEDYKMKCEEFGLEYIGFHKESHKGTMIDYICHTHRDKGIQSTDWSHFRVYTYGCRYCSGRGMTTEEAQKKIKNPNIILISPYQGAEKPVQCHCNVCGNDWTSNRPMDLFRRECGCPVCGEVNRRLNRRNTHEDFAKRLETINPNIELIGEYTRVHDFIKCKCKIHGIEWESIACNLLNETAGCPICNSSKGERELIEALISLNVNYTTQKIFKDCRDKLPLRFDAFDIDRNIAFEFQGEQHYYPVDFKFNNPDKAKEDFDALQRRDGIKKRYCKDNDIKLICIPYWERGNVLEYLIENIDEYKEVNTA